MDYQEAIYCMKVMADEEVCEDCNYYQLCDHTKQADMARIVISAMDELQQYKQLGNLEEVREAVEKQKAKEPRATNRCYVCPRCGLVTSIKIKHNYCDACGQHIDWSEEE